MARSAAREEATKRRSYWSSEIAKAKKRFQNFWEAGERVIDEYRLQKADGNDAKTQDKYNILFSSTETIRPNLYAQRPTVRAQLRHKDRARQDARDAVELLGNCCQYVVEEDDLDEVMENAVEDLLLPGMGNAWVRYEPTFEAEKGEDGAPVLGDDGKPREKLLDEQICFEYVYWQDFLTGVSRGWRTVPWVAKRCWLTKDAATKRFGADKANLLTYTTRESNSRDADNSEETAEVWEIWDKRSKNVIWFADGFAGDVLDIRPDPLNLRGFFPCPRPMRAISNTRTFVPRALYSQYKTQAETLNQLTKRIRLLTEALKVVGVYDGSQAKLADLLSPNSGNKMVPIESWTSFAQDGGLKGSIEWLPIDAVVSALTQTLQAREICKNEIYEITGFSDIVRGVSKASETLGAQNIKANWAGARVKRMQKEVQRFARDLIAIAGEIIAEHCQESTIALFGGIDIPSPEEVQRDQNAMQVIERFKAAVNVLRSEGRRVASIDIETDSTILADEQIERKDRTDFLAAAGAFLQQAVPAMTATPELGPLLGAMLMFVVRTFPSSRPIEEEFDKVQKALANRPPQDQNKDPNGHAAKAQATQQVAQVRAQTDTARIQAETQTKQQEIAAAAQIDQQKLELERTAEENRHAERMAEIEVKRAELTLREREVAVKEAELGIKQQQADTQAAAQETAARTAEHGAMMAEAGHEQEYERMEREESRESASEGLTGDAD